MTTKEYKKYQNSVKAFFAREGINCLSGDGIPHFTWRGCECCGSKLGSTVETATGYHPATNQIFSYKVCLDCLYYVTYGQLDDMTMMDMTD